MRNNTIMLCVWVGRTFGFFPRKLLAVRWPAVITTDRIASSDYFGWNFFRRFPSGSVRRWTAAAASWKTYDRVGFTLDSR